MSSPDAIRILFVCMGNICRSPMAEAVFRHQVEARGLGDRFLIDSCGTGGWHVGAPADPRAQAAISRRGIAMDHRARQITADDLSRFHHLICMDEDNRQDILDIGAPASKVRLLLEFDETSEMSEVPDPYHGGAEGFEMTYRLVDRACGALLDTLLHRDP